jgi:ABC-type transport system involved in multi-copper enzyme maturation permease subunit
MVFLPVVAREMSVLSRRQSTYWGRAVTAVIAVLTMIWLLLVSASRVSLAELGSSIFMVLSSFCFGFCLLVGMHSTSDSVSEEKREGTLGLLFLTDLKALDIVLGKMAASSFHAFFAVLGVVPMLSLALLLGGVTLTQIALVALALFNTMFLSLSLGIFVSTMSSNERKAMFACFTGLFVLTILPFVVSYALSDFDKIYAQLVFISPLYSFLCIQAPPGSPLNTHFLPVVLVFQHLLAWGFLIIASRILPGCVNELPRRRFAWVQTAISNYVFGKREQRIRYRTALLNRNPFLWLAARERIKPRYAWVIVLFFGALFLWVEIQFPNMFFDPPVPLIIIFLIHFILKVWTTSEVCSRLIADRRSGALELLLSSPLGVRDIAKGQDLALRRIFRWPVLTLIVAEVAMLLATLRQMRPDMSPLDIWLLYGTAISTLLLDLWALKWVGLWLSLFGKSIERVLILTITRVLGIPTLIFALAAGTLSAAVIVQNERIPFSAFLGLWLGISLPLSGIFALTARRNFLRYFREAASQSFNPRASAATVRKPKARKVGGTRGELIATALREHWILSSAALILAFAFIAAGGRNIYWRRQVNAELTRIRARNEPTSAAEISKLYTPLPSSEDAFVFLRSAGAVNWSRWLTPGYANLIFSSVGAKQHLERLDECARALTNNQPQLAAFHELHRYSKAYLDPHQATAFWRPPVDFSGYLALISAEILVAGQQHDSSRVQAAIMSLLHFTKLLRAQPASFLQAYALQSTMALGHSLEFAFDRDLLTVDALVPVQLALDKVDDPEVLGRTLAIERVLTLERWNHPESSAFVPKPPVLFVAANGLLEVIGSYHRAEAEILHQFGEVQSLISAPRSQLLGGIPRPALSGISSGLIASSHSSPLLITEADTLVSRQLAMISAAVAAEIYRQKHGYAPQTLSQLVPQLLEHVPSDPFTGEPLQIQHTDDWVVIGVAQRGTRRSTADDWSFRFRSARKTAEAEAD